jgi:hypothetical protein
MRALQACITDPALSGLPAALDPEAMSPKLGSLLGGDPRAWKVAGLEVVKHKPGRRCALAYSLRGPGGLRQVFAKTFKNDRGATILCNMFSFHRALDQEEVLVPTPLGYLADVRMLVTEYLDGRLLATQLYDGRSDNAARRMARAVAALHGCDVVCARRWRPAKEMRNTTEWIAGLSGRSPRSSARARELLDTLQGQAESLPSKIRRPIHRDFYPEQLSDVDGVTALLDLDDSRAGDPALDLGNFVAHLELRSMQFPGIAAACRRARRVFLDQYLRLRPVVDDPTPLAARVRFYEATSLLRLSGVYAARDRWSALLPDRLLDACESVVNGGS